MESEFNEASACNIAQPESQEDTSPDQGYSALGDQDQGYQDQARSGVPRPGAPKPGVFRLGYPDQSTQTG